MLGDVKIIDKRSGGWASTWEYFCGNSMGRTVGNWPSASTRRTETKTMVSEPVLSEIHRQPRGIGKEFVKGVKGAATGGIPAMAGASIQMGAAQVENLSEPKTWYDYVGAALTMASLAAKGALSFVSPPDPISRHELAPVRLRLGVRGTRVAAWPVERTSKCLPLRGLPGGSRIESDRDRRGGTTISQPTWPGVLDRLGTLIDLLSAIAGRTGPETVLDLAIWTASGVHGRRLAGFIRSGRCGAGAGGGRVRPECVHAGTIFKLLWLQFWNCERMQSAPRHALLVFLSTRSGLCNDPG